MPTLIPRTGSALQSGQGSELGLLRAGAVIIIPAEFFLLVIYFSVRKECGEFTPGLLAFGSVAASSLRGKQQRQMAGGVEAEEGPGWICGPSSGAVT